MGITVKTARMALLVVIFYILGVYLTPNVQAQTDWWYNYNWSGNGYPNSFGGEVGQWAYWYDSVRYSYADHDGLRDYQTYFDNWSGQYGLGAHVHTQPSRDVLNFMGGDDINVNMTGGSRHYVVINDPIGQEYTYGNNGAGWDGITHVGNMLIGGGHDWSFQGSGHSTVHGTGTLYLQGGIQLTVFDDVTFDFDKGVQVDNVNNISLWGGNAFGIYRYDATKPNANTLFINQSTTITRPQDSIVTVGMQNRTVVEEGQTLTFNMRGDDSIEIHNIDSRASGLTDRIHGGALELKAGADITKVNRTVSGKYLGLLDIYSNMAYNGGAFYAEQNLTIQGNTRIHGNAATNTGGAIYMAGANAAGNNTLTFDTTDGYIALHNNYVGLSDGTKAYTYLKPTGEYITNLFSATINQDIVGLTLSNNDLNYYAVGAGKTALEWSSTQYVYEVVAGQRLAQGFNGLWSSSVIFALNNRENLQTVNFSLTSGGLNDQYLSFAVPYFIGGNTYTYPQIMAVGYTYGASVYDTAFFRVEDYYAGNRVAKIEGYDSLFALTTTQKPVALVESGYLFMVGSNNKVQRVSYVGTNGPTTEYYELTATKTIIPVTFSVGSDTRTELFEITSSEFPAGYGIKAWVFTPAGATAPTIKYYKTLNGDFVDSSDTPITPPAQATTDLAGAVEVPLTPPLTVAAGTSTITPLTTYNSASPYYNELNDPRKQTLSPISTVTELSNNLTQNSIYLNKNTAIKIQGTRVLFIEDGIMTGTDSSTKGNSLDVNITGEAVYRAVQFGANSRSLLNASSNAGGQVTVTNGEFRVLKGGEFRTRGTDATFTVLEGGKLGGQGLIGAEQGFLIQGELSPDGLEYKIPTSLVPREMTNQDIGGTGNIGHMVLQGTVAFDGALYRVTTSPSSSGSAVLLKDITATETNPLYQFTSADASVLNADLIQVLPDTAPGSGKILLTSDTGKSSVTFDTWYNSDGITGGKYVIASSKVGFFDSKQDTKEVTSDRLADYFYEIVPSDISLNMYKRAGASMYIQRGLLDTNKTGNDREYDLVLQTTNDGNVNLIWTGKTSAQWNDSAINWIRRVERTSGSPLDIELSFKEGDFVTFNKPDNVRGRDVVVINGWDVGGMRVEGGDYYFTGGAVTGKADTNYIGIQATGRLDITSVATAPTKVFFEQDNYFEKGTLITGKGAEIKIGHDKSLGVYTGSANNTLFGHAAPETGTVYLDNAVAALISSSDTSSRILKNHFELINNSEFTLNIPEGTSLTISNVNTTGFGGAVYIESGSTLKRATRQLLTFENNSALRGGAIYGFDSSASPLTITGNTLFRGNTADKGGAIYFDTQSSWGNLTFDTTNGDIVFDGNSTSGDSNNGIYLAGRTNLTINTLNGHNLFLNDSIDFDTVNGGYNTLTKTGSGFVQLTGINKFSNSSKNSGGQINVQSGELHLAQIAGEAPAEFHTGSSSQSSYLNVANGAKLSGNGTFDIRSTRGYVYEFGNGSIIAPDSAVFKSALTGSEHTTITNGEAIGKLTLQGGGLQLNGSIIDIDLGGAGVNDFIEVTDGNINLAGTSSNKTRVDVRSVAGTTPSGNYLIVQATGLLISADGNSVAKLTDHITSNLDSNNSRGGSGTLVFGLNGTIITDLTSTSDANQLWVYGYSAGANMTLYWTGKDSTAWDEAATKNWQEGSNESDFLSNDYVTFDTSVIANANPNVVLTGGDKNVTGMDVRNGAFNISNGNGGDYTIVNQKYGSVGGTPSGKLVVGGGANDAELTLGVATDFVEGTELREKGKIIIGNDKALGVYNHSDFTSFADSGTAITSGSKTGYVNVTGNATIAATEEHIIANRFNIADDKSLKVDVAAGTKLFVSNVITNAADPGIVVLGNGAALEKTNTGNLVFTNNTGAGNASIFVKNGASATIAANAGDIIFNGGIDSLRGGAGSVITLTGNSGSRIYMSNPVNGNQFRIDGSVTAIVNDDFNATGTFELLSGATLAGKGKITASDISLKGTVDPAGYSVTNGQITGSAIAQTLTFSSASGTTFDGATVKIDLGTAGAAGASGTADLIKVTGNVNLTSKSTIAIASLPSTAPAGEYKIIEVTSGTFLAGTTNAMDYFTATSSGASREKGYKAEFRNSMTELWLIEDSAPASMDLYWTGKNGTATDGNWVKSDTTKKNWRDGANPANPQYFLDNDSVHFTGDTWVSTRSVKLANDTYNVGAMEVTGGTYTFGPVTTGGTAKIAGTAGNLTVSGSSTDATFDVALDFNNLNVSGAKATLNKENNFSAVSLTGASTVTLGNAKGLGDNNTVTVAGTTLKATNNYTLNNTFVLNNGDLTIDTDKNLKLNKALSGTGNFIKENTGSVGFAAASNITGNTAIKKGEAKFDANYTSTGTFTLDAGATVSSGSNATITVNASQFNLKGTVSVTENSKITFNSANAVAFDGATLAVDANTTSALIHVTNAAVISGTGNAIDIGNDVAWNGADYIIVTADGGITKDGAVLPADLKPIFTLKQGGAVINNSRQTYAVKSDAVSKSVLLHLDVVTNEALYWNGSPTNDWSNGNNENWYEAPDTSASKAVFVAGDFVNFQSNLASDTSVKVGNNYMTSGMKIINGDYTFTGGGAISGNTTVGNYTGVKTGKLEINGDSAGTGKTTFEVATHFEKGIDVNGNRNIIIGNNQALGNTATSNGDEGQVKIAAGKIVTIETKGNDDLDINNHFVVDSGAKLNFVTRGRSLNIDNPNGSTVELNGATLTVDAGEGDHVAFENNINGTGTNTFLKTGTGDVSFTGTNNLGSGSTATIANGKLILENTADKLTVGTFNVNPGATLTGNGTVDAANTTFAAGSIIDPGTNDIGTLTLAGNTTFDNVIYQVQTEGNGVADKIVTNNVTFTGNNTVKITQWNQGKYDIITASGTMTGSNTWKVDTSILPNTGRAGATIQQVTKNGLEVLELNATITNAHLTWTGASNLNWDGSTVNWTNNDKQGQQDIFMDGDAVFFTGAAQGNVDVTSGLKISDMTITNGTYNFRGELTGLKGTSTLSDAKGMLNISGGQTTFNNKVDFAGGINVTKGSVTLKNDGKLISGKDIVFGTGTTLSFTPVTGIITAAGKVEINGNVKFGIPTADNILDVIIAGVALDVPHLQSVFSTTSGLNARLATFSDGDKRMSLEYSQITPSEFATINNLEWNEREAAKGITSAINSGTLDNIGELKDYLYSLDSDAEVESVLDQVRGTEMAASALTASLWEPWQKVYKQLRTRDDQVTSSYHAVNGQAPKFKGREVWIEGYYRYLDVNGDRNAKKYYEKRGGMVMGLDSKINHHSTLGISFGYGNPELYSKFGQVKTNDYTLALYNKTQIQSDVFLNIYGGLGFQNYEYKRFETLAGYTSQYNGDYDSNSAYISAEVYKPYKWNEAFTLFPLIALDYQRAWSSGFEETDGLFNQKIYKSNVDRFVARIGLDSKLQYSDSVNFLTRLQYGFMMGGDTRASLNTSFVGTGTQMNMRGVHLGRSQIDMGIGGEWYLDQRKCLKFFGDYDLNFGSRHSAQTGQLGLTVQW